MEIKVVGRVVQTACVQEMVPLARDDLQDVKFGWRRLLELITRDLLTSCQVIRVRDMKRRKLCEHYLQGSSRR